MNAIKTSHENKCQRMIQSTHWCSFSNGTACLELANIRYRKRGTPSTNNYIRWDSRSYELWCRASMVQGEMFREVNSTH